MFKYFSRSAVAAAALVVSLGAQAGILIDDFSAPSTGEQLATDVKFKGVGESVGSSAAGQSGSMIGGNRDIFVIETEVADPTRGDGGSSGGHINVADGVLGFSTDAGQYAVGIIRWDGASHSFAQDSSKTTAQNVDLAVGSISTTGFTAENLSGSAVAFKITVLSADAGFPFTLQAGGFRRGGGGGGGGFRRDHRAAGDHQFPGQSGDRCRSADRYRRDHPRAWRAGTGGFGDAGSGADTAQWQARSRSGIARLIARRRKPCAGAARRHGFR